MLRSRFAALGLLAVLAIPACTEVPDVLAPGQDAAPAADHTGGTALKVMSQNMYLGANIDLLLTAQTPQQVAEVFQQLRISTQAGNFARAYRLAEQIATQAPHLVGLQEVTTYVLDFGGGVTQTLDFLYVLQAHLAYFAATRGTPTYTAHRAVWTSVAFPASVFDPAFPDVTYQDGDAVLVRSDVPLVGSPTLKSYDTFEVFQVAGTFFENHRGYIAVSAEIDDQVIRFVNTHLEVQMFETTQLAQAAELVGALEDETLPVVIVGDFNSAANHDSPESQMTGSYRLFRNAGYADMWLRQPHSVGGVTCCQAPTLTNAVSELGQRLDLVLVRWDSAGFGGQSYVDLVGEDPDDRLTFADPELGTLTLWPSDHAGIVATLWPAPGRLGND